MKKTNMTGYTVVGDLRLSAIDVGFDMRRTGHLVKLPKTFTSVGLDDGRGETWLIEGTRTEMIAEIQANGYRVAACDLASSAKGDRSGRGNL
jgi:hypothetical protein